MKRLSLLILFVFILAKSHATHIVGGEITYTCLGNNKYEVNLHVYRDCFNGVPPFDNPASLGVFSSDNQLLQSVNLIWNQLDDTLLIYLNNPCLTRPPNVCVHRTTYTTLLHLPPQPGGYKLVYQRCCRNELIRNIPYPEDVGITIISEISENALLECNSSAVYKNWPPLAICVHEPIDFDHAATDADGDTLVYRICTPLSGADPFEPMPQPPNPGPYDEIAWKSPYNLSNLLGGQPLAIDPHTGFMTGIPNTVGNFVVGVCVDEYREGSLISTTRRDFQYNVADCGVPVAGFVQPDTQCDNLEVSLQNTTDLNPLGTTQWYFDWGGDQSLTSDERHPSFTYPDTGHYQIALITNAGYTCCDTVVKNIWLTETTANAVMDMSYGPCTETTLQLRLNSLSSDPQYGLSNVAWEITGPGSWVYNSISPTIEIPLNLPGDYTVSLTATGNNGCARDTISSFFVPQRDGNNFAYYLICEGDSIAINPDGLPSLEYQWSPASSLNDSNSPQPVATPTAFTTYTATITAPDLGCTWNKTVQVSVIDDSTIFASAQPTQIYAGESSQLDVSFYSGVNYQWRPSATLSNDHIFNPVATPEETTDYTVQLTLSTGCSKEATVRVAVLNPECGAPYIFFPTAFSPNGDGENEALKMESNYTNEVYWMIYNRFGEKVFEAFSIDAQWDGTWRGQPQPAETYGYYYRVICKNRQVAEQKGNVTLLR